MFCPNCGKEIDNSDKFCKNCGAEIINHTDNSDSANVNSVVESSEMTDSEATVTENEPEETVNDNKLESHKAQKLQYGYTAATPNNTNGSFKNLKSQNFHYGEKTAIPDKGKNNASGVYFEPTSQPKSNSTFNNGSSNFSFSELKNRAGKAINSILPENGKDFLNKARQLLNAPS